MCFDSEHLIFQILIAIWRERKEKKIDRIQQLFVKKIADSIIKLLLQILKKHKSFKVFPLNKKNPFEHILSNDLYENQFHSQE